MEVVLGGSPFPTHSLLACSCAGCPQSPCLPFGYVYGGDLVLTSEDPGGPEVTLFPSLFCLPDCGCLQDLRSKKNVVSHEEPPPFPVMLDLLSSRGPVWSDEGKLQTVVGEAVRLVQEAFSITAAPCPVSVVFLSLRKNRDKQRLLLRKLALCHQLLFPSVFPLIQI
ncbi:UNVERIFIED_CONTAM: hypothetical protein K2H54_068918 [Gekko kuhli]